MARIPVPAAYSCRFVARPLSEFKTLLRDQFAMLLIDEKAALAAIFLSATDRCRNPQRSPEAIRQVMTACGETSADDEKRFGEIGRLFGIGEGGAALRLQNRSEALAEASERERFC